MSVRPVEIVGTVHGASGELEGLHHLHGDRYLRRLQHRRRDVGVRGHVQSRHIPNDAWAL